jgi:hypothetical protein
MNGILDDALSGLLLLREGINSNNDSKDHCRTQSSNDSSMTLPSNDSNMTHTSDDSSATPTSSPLEKKRNYKKRGRLAVPDDRPLGNQKKTLITMWQTVATGTGGGGGNGNNRETEGRELFEGVIIVGHWSSVPPSLNPNVSESHLFSSPHGRALTTGGCALTMTMTTVVD